MRAMCGIGMMLAVVTLVGCGNKDAKLDGTYTIVGLEMGGEKLPDEFVSKAPEAERTIKIEGDKLIAKKGEKDDIATFKTDTSKTPHHIDIIAKKGGEGGKDETMYAIYKLEGDTLTICGVETGKMEDRPKEFKTAKDSKSVMMTLKKK